jgi:ATP-dependent Clp protease ATP-binding subunit ClpC
MATKPDAASALRSDANAGRVFRWALTDRSMLERLTTTAAEALRIAESEADAGASSTVGSEHLLLALLQVRGVAAVVLRQSGAELAPLRVRIAARGRGSPFAIARKLTQALKKSLGGDALRYAENLTFVIARADDAARELAHPKIGTEHLLWALVEHGDGATREYFESIDLSPEQARRQILEMLRVAQTALEDQSTNAVAARKRKKAPMLEAFTHDLVRRARKDRLPKLVRRVHESEHLRESLLRMTTRSALISGPNGAGKTSLVQGLAKEIALGAAPQPLLGKRIREIDPILLVAGTRYRGEFESRVVAMLAEAVEAQNVILFLDDVHLLVPPGEESAPDDFTAGAADLLDLLSPAIERAEASFIVTVDSRAETRATRRFPVLATAFHRFTIAEPERETSQAILAKKRAALEAHHGLTIEAGALEAALEIALANDTTPRPLIVRALDLLDGAAARHALERDLRGLGNATIDRAAIGSYAAQKSPPLPISTGGAR